MFLGVAFSIPTTKPLLSANVVYTEHAASFAIQASYIPKTSLGRLAPNFSDSRLTFKWIRLGSGSLLGLML